MLLRPFGSIDYKPQPPPGEIAESDEIRVKVQSLFALCCGSLLPAKSTNSGRRNDQS